jgi:hypothetical protein
MSRIRTIKPDFFTHEDLFDAEQESGLPLRLTMPTALKALRSRSTSTSGRALSAFPKPSASATRSARR